MYIDPKVSKFIFNFGKTYQENLLYLMNCTIVSFAGQIQLNNNYIKLLALVQSIL